MVTKPHFCKKVRGDASRHYNLKTEYQVLFLFLDILKMSKNEKSFNRYVKNWKWHCETINFQKTQKKIQKWDHNFFRAFSAFQKPSKKHQKQRKKFIQKV